MLKDSFWWPTDMRRGIVLLAVIVMIPLHQSELLGLMDSSMLVFGWLPMQLAWDITFNLLGVVILYAMYRMAPKPGTEFEPSTEPKPDSDADVTATMTGEQ